MPPKKRGQKRKNTTQISNTDGTNEDGTPLPPDRATWPGWVEMESEPAFFNVMLKEMGVRGVKVQEVYGLDEEMLAILPQPVHALIFLFRYRDTDQAQQGTGEECPDHIWFANQIPDFACASVALLNIVNNIKGLQMGKDLQDFRTFTQAMDPMSRGDAIDSFDFVKRIHNSFAREADLLAADMHMKQKATRAKKKQAAAKARETKQAKKAGNVTLGEKSLNATAAPTRISARSPKATAKTKKPASLASRGSSPLSDPPDDSDFESSSKGKTPAKKFTVPQRRSDRAPQPRKDAFASSAAVEADEEDGFHFIAFMPIQGHVWKLDGLDSFPQDMGEFDATTGGDWMNIAQPVLQTRMAMYEGERIEFNLMAVVHDPTVTERGELLRNVKELQAVEQKLDLTANDWRTLDLAQTKKNVVTGTSVDLDISQADVDGIELCQDAADEVKKYDDLMDLLELRKKILCRQAPLRGAVRDTLEGTKADDEKAKHRRHDYGKFVRSWLGSLAEEELLSDVLEGT